MRSRGRLLSPRIGFLLVLGAALGVHAQGRWRPEIPRVWDEAAIASIEVPLPQAHASPVHLTAEQYYSIPAREVPRVRKTGAISLRSCGRSEPCRAE